MISNSKVRYGEAHSYSHTVIIVSTCSTIRINQSRKKYWKRNMPSIRDFFPTSVMLLEKVSELPHDCARGIIF